MEVFTAKYFIFLHMASLNKVFTQGNIYQLKENHNTKFSVMNYIPI